MSAPWQWSPPFLVDGSTPLGLPEIPEDHPNIGWMSEARSRADDATHLVVDLGTTTRVGAVRLLPAKKPTSDLCDQHGIHPTLFYRWQKEFFENGAAACEQGRPRHKAATDAKDRKIVVLEQKLQQKNEVLAELRQEDVQLNKERGEPCKASGFPTTPGTRS